MSRRRSRRKTNTTLDVTVDAGESRSRGSKKKSKRYKATGKAVSPEVERTVDEFVNSVIAKGVQGCRTEFAEMKTYIPENYKYEAFTANMAKNRYKDVVCLDSTRVVLTLNVPPETDYIHANWVKMNNVDKIFIATQAPLESTICDFWRLCYQENVATIIMLCKCEENGKTKSAQYWPAEQGSYKTYGSMFVNNKRVERKDKFTSYVLEVLPEGCSNSVFLTLVHMTDWPDRGVPASGRSVLRLLRLIENTGPCVLHCSAGIGRTGAVIGIETIMQRLWKCVPVNMKDVLRDMRNQRASCIQTEAQYVFVVATVLEYIKVKMPEKYWDKVTQFQEDMKKAAMV